MAESDQSGGGYVQLPADCVTMCAESLGITQLAQDVVPALAEDVNYRVREATQNAIQFMRHAKRRKLMTDDFDKALYWSNVEVTPQYCVLYCVQVELMARLVIYNHLACWRNLIIRVVPCGN